VVATPSRATDITYVGWAAPAPYLDAMALTIFGITALTFMMLMYALERRGPAYVLAFALGCGLSSTYGFLSGVWPFGVVEAIWMVIAVNRFWTAHRRAAF